MAFTAERLEKLLDIQKLPPLNAEEPPPWNDGFPSRWNEFDNELAR